VKWLHHYLIHFVTYNLQLTSSSRYSIKVLVILIGDHISMIEILQQVIVFIFTKLFPAIPKNKNVVSHSSIEVEYRNIVALIYKITWISSLLHKLIFLLTTIYSDNLGVVLLAIWILAPNILNLTYTLFVIRSNNIKLIFLLTKRIPSCWYSYQTSYVLLSLLNLDTKLRWNVIPP